MNHKSSGLLRCPRTLVDGPLIRHTHGFQLLVPHLTVVSVLGAPMKSLPELI